MSVGFKSLIHHHPPRPNTITLPSRANQTHAKKRVSLTLGEQAEVARQLRLGTDAGHVMSTLKVSRRTVFNIKNNADKILKLPTASTTPLSSKSSRPPLFPMTERKLYDFVIVCRAHKMPVTCSVLQQRALLLRESALESSDITASMREKLQKFTASKGWFSNFVKRYDLRTVSLSGEADSVDAAVVAADMVALRKRLED